MNKKEMVEQIAIRTNMTQKKIEEIMNVFFELTGEVLKRGGKVSLFGFGSFDTRERNARLGINPRTGEQISIPASITLVFRAGKKLKEKLK